MNLMHIPTAILRKLNVGPMVKRESEVSARPSVVRANDLSPVRFEIMAEAMRRKGARPPATIRTLPHMIASQMGIFHSLRAIDRNPARPRTQISPDALLELEAHAHSLGVAAVGYVKLPRRLVFQDKGVLFDNTIVLVMEMDRDRIDAAPGPKAGETVMETYHYLGDAANKIARYLQERGYGSHAGHPLMGLVLYPPLAQLAGLGWRGQHGLLITPQFGPRMRLAAVFTSIENLPFLDGENEHRWIEGFCRSCGRCVHQCPTQAILERPVLRDNGLWTCCDAEKCFPFFLEHHGCSVCIKVCPFHRPGYRAIERRFKRHAQ